MSPEAPPNPERPLTRRQVLRRPGAGLVELFGWIGGVALGRGAPPAEADRPPEAEDGGFPPRTRGQRSRVEGVW